MKLTCAVVLFGCLVSVAQGQVIFSDNFDQYASDSDFENVWPADLGDGQSPTGAAIGLLTPNAIDPAPFDGSGDDTVVPPVEPLVGQAVSFAPAGGVNEYSGDFSLVPDANTAVRYSADMFDFVNGNRRFSTGLRNDTADREPGIGTVFGLNFIEMGFYNEDTFDPTNPVNADPANRVFDVPTTGYGYRLILFGGVGGDLVANPNWQYFPLDIAFDDPAVDHNGDGRFGNGDGLVTPVDVGPGWHTYEATIEENMVTLTLDLFRDGTIDSTVQWEMTMATDDLGTGEIAPFTSLRMGGPSGIGTNEYTMVDNVTLELVSAGSPVTGDFNGDNQWDCGDVNSLSAEIVAGTNDPTFDMNGDGSVDDQDLAEWLVAGGANNPSATNGNPFLLGDANLDGVVDGQDFIVWNGNKFTATTGWCFGDFNADGVVDGQDYVLWNQNKFTSSDHVAVPEPMAGWLMMCGLLLLRLRRR